MLQATRMARWTRVLLFAAALAAITGSFGLHPEPATEICAPARAGSVPAWTPSLQTDQADGCTACLAHRSVSLTRLGVFSAAGVHVPRVAPLPQARLIPLSAPRFIEGRAPPSLG